MPLPADNSPWPPPEWAPIYAQMRVDDAWYSGDRRKLEEVYGHAVTGGHRTRRRLWGRRSPEFRPRKAEARLHVPLPGDIASTSADLLFSDMPSITVADTTTQDRLNVLLDEGHVQQMLLGGAEQAAGLSGVFLRVTWDRALAGRPLPSTVQPDNALPEFRHGMLRAVTFWRALPGSAGGTVWRHLERHEPGYIREYLFRGTADNLGKSMPLEAHAETAELVASLDATGDGHTITTGATRLTAVYVPNMLPNRLHRTSPIGRSDYAAPLYDLFDGLDETWSSWMRDLRLARARLIVPEQYLRDLGPGNGAAFDEDREVWQALKIPPAEAASITLNQFEIRVEEHQRTAESIIRQAAQSAGYSAQSFGIDSEGGPITATESDDREQRSEVTRRRKAGFWRHPLGDFFGAMLEVDAAQFGTRGIVADRPTIEFPDGVAESLQQVATSLDLLNRAQSASAATRVKILHPEWDDTAVQAEVRAIHAETGQGVPDPVIGG